MFKRSQLTSKKFAKRKKTFFWIKITFFLVAIVIVVASISYLLRLQSLTVSAISVHGNSAINGDEIIALSNDELRGEYYWIFPKENIFIFPKKDIEEKIKDRWKRIKSASVERSSLHSLKITIAEKEAKFLWCGETMSDTKPLCYFMDDTGYIFSKSPIFSDNVYVRFYGNIALRDPVDQMYLPALDFYALSSFIAKLEQLGIKPRKLLAKGDGEYDLFLSGGSHILFNDRQDFSKTFGNLETLLGSDAFKGDMKKASSSLDYIDVRFGNKVFYKFK